MDFISCIITPEKNENNELILTFALINLKKIKLQLIYKRKDL